MIGAPLKIVETVRVALSERVLPQLDGATWLAGDVRSSIALLTYLEDVLTHGVATMGRANAAMVAYLRDALADPSVPDALARQAADAITAAEAVACDDLTGLDRAGVSLRAALSASIAARGAGELHALPGRDRLRDCLRIVADEEQTLAARAGAMSPF